MAHAQARTATKVGDLRRPESNHVRLTAEAAHRLGIELTRSTSVDGRARLGGNALRTARAGPESTSFRSAVRPGPCSRSSRRSRWRTPPPGFSSARTSSSPWAATPGGCLGYVRAAAELDEQAREAGIGDAAWFWPPAPRDARRAPRRPASLRIGASAGRDRRRQPLASVPRLDCADGDGGLPRLRLRDRPSLHASSARGHALRRSRLRGALGGRSEGRRRLRALEGVHLDPVYTAKAFAGLLDLVGRGELGSSSPSCSCTRAVFSENPRRSLSFGRDLERPGRHGRPQTRCLSGNAVSPETPVSDLALTGVGSCVAIRRTHQPGFWSHGAG